MGTWKDAMGEGKPVGAIWSGIKQGEHLHNEVQRIDADKVAVAAGNNTGSAWTYAAAGAPVEIVLFGADQKEVIRATREEIIAALHMARKAAA